MNSGEPIHKNRRSTYQIGIDLGTTHSVLAYGEKSQGQIHIQPISQWITSSQIAGRPILPSFLYAPLPREMASEAYPDDTPWVIGEYAKTRSGEMIGRSIASSKSWLCHPGADRSAPILPWGASNTDELTDPSLGIQQISPLEAAAKILNHLKNAWNQHHPEALLQDQDVVLTVPASFDEAARDLTLRAAEQAGILNVRLLEEPQAAFYDYMRAAGLQSLEQICPPGRSAEVLVCDIGGGTMDLSLIQVDRSGADQNHRQSPKISRIAVGRHLLLGGDNMDLALAYACEQKLFHQDKSKKLSPSRFGQLVNACRAAKEKLLGAESGDEQASVPITLLGTGSNLFAGALKTQLSKHEVEEILLEGFFPRVSKDAHTQKSRAGLLAFGLPYERDSAMTRHIAEFLRKYTQSIPKALLFNGGVFLSEKIRKRIHEILSEWAGEEIIVLPQGDPELAVARGAVAYGFSLLGQGPSIESGAAHGFYIGLKGSAKDLKQSEKQAVCVVPKGSREGVRHIVEGRTFALATGTLVKFELFASNDSALHAPGEIVTIDDDRFTALPPLVMNFSSAKKGEREVRVALSGELSAVGTLELACIESGVESPRRFRLAFQLRREQEQEREGEAQLEAPPKKSAGSKALEEAKEAIAAMYGKDRPEAPARDIKDLGRKLERILGNRSDWTIETARALFDALWEYPKSRRRTAEYERVFWQWSGFCLRPGFGDAQDAPRVKAFAALFNEKLAFGDETRNWQQFWIAYRRVAGGLPENTQVLIRDTLDPFFAPAEKKLKKPKNIKPEAYFDMLELLSSLERVSADRKAELGAWILERTWTERDDRFWAALGRIGARVPAYGSVHQVVSPVVAEKWLDHLLREKWEDYPSAARAAVRIARVSGDRARDLSERIRKDVAARLTRIGAREEWVRAVTEYVAVEQEERAAFFGDSLPVGLRLLG